MQEVNQNNSLAAAAELPNKSITSTQEPQPVIEYLSIPFRFFLLLDLLTLGWYRVYWFYHNWKAIKKAGKIDISPSWRALLGIFFVGGLFKVIANTTNNYGYNKRTYHRLCADIYIILVLLHKVLLVGIALGIAIHPVKGSQGVMVLLSWIFICLEDLLFYPIQKAINFYDNKIEQERLLTTANQPLLVIEYFDISATRLLIFNVLTARFYVLYWSYKNWQAIKRAEQSDIKPFWRGVFCIFFIHDLFKKIYLSAKNQNYPKTFSYWQLTAGYISLCYYSFLIFLDRLAQLSSRMPGFWYYMLSLGMGIALDFLFLRPIQQAIRFYNTKSIPNYKPSKGFTIGEIVLSIIGLILHGLLLLMSVVGSAQLVSKAFPS